MDENLREALANQILASLEALSGLTPGTDEYTAAVNAATKLYSTGLEDVKIDSECDDKIDRFNTELEKAKRDEEYRDKQDKEQQIDRYVRYGLEALGIVLPIAFYATWMKRGFRFEETGTYTSNTFKNLFGKFRPTK